MAATYYPISLDEMTKFLNNQNFGMYNPGRLKTHTGGPVHEIVFARVFGQGDRQIVMRVYTGIDSRTGRSRDVGADAIRVSLWYSHNGKVLKVGGSKRVHRVEGWKANLQDRIDNWRDQLGPPCPKCGRPLVLRKPSKKSNKKFDPFYGCVAWERDGSGCNGSMSVVDWESKAA